MVREKNDFEKKQRESGKYLIGWKLRSEWMIKKIRNDGTTRVFSSEGCYYAQSSEILKT